MDNGVGDDGVPGMVAQHLACNYSFEVVPVSEYTVCNGGVEVVVVVSAFDWCTGLRHELDYLLLKAADKTKPIIKKPGKPVILSTGAGN